MCSQHSPLLRSIDHCFKKRLRASGGRNYLGRVCIQHRGGGRLRLYRPIDNYRRINCHGRIFRLYRDSYRTGFVAMILYENGFLSAILAVEGLRVGSLLFSGAHWPTIRSPKLIYEGSSMLLRYMNVFTPVCSVETQPFRGMQLFRSAGVGGILVSKNSTHATLKSPSGWLIKVSLNCMAVLGRISNIAHRFSPIPSAGFNRHRGIRPTVRGVAKNPCDHPHGGGEGKASPPAAQLTPWAKLTKGTPTTKKKWAKRRRRLFRVISNSNTKF